MIATVFWISAASVAYTYVGYPALILLRGALVHRPFNSEEVTPTVTVVIAAHNEAEVISGRLENLLACDYPQDRLEILVASDGSDDATTRIVASHAGLSVQVLDLPRCGKTAALNAACAEASGEVLVFSDANTVFAPDALRAIVRPLADPAVGGVAGDQRYLTGDDDLGVGAGEQQYWDFDRLLKRAQSRAGSVISATGAIYAMKRELYQPLPPGVTDDFMSSTAVIDQGFRLVFESRARAYETAASSAPLEFGRKVRVITQGLRAVGARRRLLDPRRTGFYALQLLSHKLLRRMTVVPLAALAVTAPLLWQKGVAYRVATLVQGMVYLSAAIAAAWSLTGRPLPKVLALPMYFVVVNGACLVAIVNMLRGRRIDRWVPDR